MANNSAYQVQVYLWCSGGAVINGAAQLVLVNTDDAAGFDFE